MSKPVDLTENKMMSSLLDEVKIEVAYEDQETAKLIINNRLREIMQAEKVLSKLKTQLHTLLNKKITDVVSL